ncbi:hypothetical protein B4N89_00395 [Embleya scabrispora]|uniref:Uncharacterized protein n=1 Tax=Embleya scabrispora TaxID=159449 RepID=A0A1T3NSL7_9ACTN|nr:hypothetical protein [Embleya scabrispora]OPC79611.1 hypothetical protein B4N89_00395 [Embleya scabrispora]
MRTRRALVGLTLGATLALLGMGATAQAAEPADSATTYATSAPVTRPIGADQQQVKASWHFYHAYWTKGTCAGVGIDSGKDWLCQYKKGNDGKMKWFLYLWY